MNGAPELGEQALPKDCSMSRRPGCAQGSWCSSIPALSCPLPLTPSLQKDNEERVWGRGGLEEEQRAVASLCSPRAAPLPGDKTAEKASEPWCCSCCQAICCHKPQGTWERCCMELGIVPGQDGICCRSGICLFSNCLLPEQGSHPEGL